MSQAQTINDADAHAALMTVRALELRRDGLSYRQIGIELGISYGSAYKYVSQALAEVREEAHESAGELREIELTRLDDLYMRLQAKLNRQMMPDPNDATKQVPCPDEVTVRAMLDVQRRRAELIGLDAPRRTELGGPDGGPIPVVVGDGRSILMSRLADIERRRAAVQVPDAAKEVQANPGLIAPGLSQNGNGDAAKSGLRPDDYHKTNGDGQNGNGTNRHP